MNKSRRLFMLTFLLGGAILFLSLISYSRGWFPPGGGVSP